MMNQIAVPRNRKKQGDDNLSYNDEETSKVISNLKSFIDGKGGKPKVDDFFEEIRMFQLAQVFDHKVRLYVAIAACCGESMDAAAVNTNKKYIAKCIQNASMSGEDVLWAFNAYLAANAGAAKGFAMVLKAVYEEDWAEEKEILDYYNDDGNDDEPGFEEAKKKAAPFLKWLATVDDDSDSDSDSD